MLKKCVTSFVFSYGKIAQFFHTKKQREQKGRRKAEKPSPSERKGRGKGAKVLGTRVIKLVFFPS